MQPLFYYPTYLPLYDAPALQPLTQAMTHPFDLSAPNTVFSRAGRFYPAYFAIHRCWLALPVPPAYAYGAMSLCFAVASGACLYAFVYLLTRAVVCALPTAMFLVCSPYFVATHLSPVNAEILLIPCALVLLMCCTRSVRSLSNGSYAMMLGAIFILAFVSLCIKESAVFLIVPAVAVLLIATILEKGEGGRPVPGRAIVLCLAVLAWFAYRSTYVDVALAGYAAKKIDASGTALAKQALYWVVELAFACPLVVIFPLLGWWGAGADRPPRPGREPASAAFMFSCVAAAATVLHFVIRTLELRYVLLPLTLATVCVGIGLPAAYRAAPRLTLIAAALFGLHNCISGASCRQLAVIAMRTERAAMERLAELPERALVQVVARSEDESKYLAENIALTLRDRFDRGDLTIVAKKPSEGIPLIFETNRTYNDEWGQDVYRRQQHQTAGVEESRIEYSWPVWQCRGLHVIREISESVAAVDARLDAVGLVIHRTFYDLQTREEPTAANR